ncbi:MAG TPA: LytTR family DNA-binding domain-containing protein [Flavihumibacter sp.]|jgi:DNA-binding LytR/AlgR family response regulator
MAIKALIVDDEPRAVEVLKKYVQQVPEIELSGICHNGIQAFQALQKQAVDLVFLDINMPGLSGIELVKSVPNPPLIIFTTAHMEYAIDGFELNAADYLLKPISFERFLKAVSKAMNLQKLAALTSPSLIPATPEPIAQPFYIYMRIDRQLIKLNTDEILWIESDKDYIKVVTSKSTYMTKQKISAMENLLPIHAFLRVHRSFIIPLGKVEGYNPNYLIVASKKIPIGKNYKQACMDKFNPGNHQSPVFVY